MTPLLGAKQTLRNATFAWPGLLQLHGFLTRELEATTPDLYWRPLSRSAEKREKCLTHGDPPQEPGRDSSLFGILSNRISSLWRWLCWLTGQDRRIESNFSISFSVIVWFAVKMLLHTLLVWFKRVPVLCNPVFEQSMSGTQSTFSSHNWVF